MQTMIDSRIVMGLDLLLDFDGYLLKNELSERSITHKLGEHYQRMFYEWNVDCEYNKNLGESKEIDINPRELLAKMAAFAADNRKFVFSQKELEREDYEALIQQLKDPTLEYVDDLDLWLVVLEMHGKTIRKKIFPDIIVHHRGTMQNYLVIEAKKSTNHNATARAYDLLKLATLAHSPDYLYQHGVFIDLPVSADFERFAEFQIRPRGFDRVFEIYPEYGN